MQHPVGFSLHAYSVGVCSAEPGNIGLPLCFMTCRISSSCRSHARCVGSAYEGRKLPIAVEPQKVWRCQEGKSLSNPAGHEKDCRRGITPHELRDPSDWGETTLSRVWAVYFQCRQVKEASRVYTGGKAIQTSSTRRRAPVWMTVAHL